MHHSNPRRMSGATDQGGPLPGRLTPPFRWILAVAILCWVNLGFAEQQYGPVRPGESLWTIAGHIRSHTQLSRDQVMLALLRTNPSAFSIPCNVNGALKVGAVLQVPSTDQMAVPVAQSARAEVAAQNSVWRIHLAQGGRLECPASPPEISYHPQRGWLDEGPQRGPVLT